MTKFILTCLEQRENRPSARELLESDFLKDLDSEATNNPVKLKPKNKDKFRSGKHQPKTIEVFHNK